MANIAQGPIFTGTNPAKDAALGRRRKTEKGRHDGQDDNEVFVAYDGKKYYHVHF